MLYLCLNLEVLSGWEDEERDEGIFHLLSCELHGPVPLVLDVQYSPGCTV